MTSLARAQSGTIHIIVGTAPGGAIDPYARMIAEHMSKTLGQPIIIENKPGASGSSPGNISRGFFF
jgi:tripartite-type tricarboxylate transporter receptor subunit TctC